MKDIRKLYAVESELRSSPDLDRAAVRQLRSIPVLERIKGKLDEKLTEVLPQSSLGKAIQDTLARWSKLTVYTEHSEMEIDNNLIENAIRPTAIGKKNFLFFGSPDAGQTSAVIYSLMESCRKLEINPADYLRDVLTSIPEMTNHTAVQFTPSQWKARQKQAVEGNSTPAASARA